MRRSRTAGLWDNVRRMNTPSRTLAEIRSDACNQILMMLAAVAVFGVAVIAARLLEQGFAPVMAVHGVLLILLTTVIWRRRHLNFILRAATVTAIPFVIGATSVVASGRLSGSLMFFISSIVTAGCFFGRRVAFGLIGAALAVLGAVYAGFRSGVLIPQFSPLFDLSPVTWLSIFMSFIYAAAAPVVAVYAVYQALEAERVRANAAAEARTAFLANMSHELRTPMAGIIGMAELLRDDKLGAQREALAANLIGASRNLMAVLNDLLDFAKFKTGRILIEQLPFKLSDLAGDLSATFATMAGQKGLAFRIEFPRHFQDDLVGDPHRIVQVLSNLIDNAVKFTADGAVTLALEQATDAGGLMLIGTVTDTGIGITPEQHTAIFEPFVQGDSSISRKYGGSGLGLAICRGLVETMGGTLSFTSKPGRGSVFTVRIPVAPAEAPAVVAAAPAPLPTLPPIGPRGPVRALKLLAAEDDAAMRLILEIKMEQWGHACTIVGDGLAALKEAAAGGYDCILMDMHMPIMNGPDAVRAIRAAEAARGGRRVPIIAITADLIPERVRGFREAGVDDVAGKPVAWDAVAAQILKLTRAT